MYLHTIYYTIQNNKYIIRKCILNITNTISKDFKQLQSCFFISYKEYKSANIILLYDMDNKRYLLSLLKYL